MATLHYIRKGDSKEKVPVIFIHAFPLHHAMWAAQMEALSKKFLLYAVDLPGFGKSPSLRDPVEIGAYVQAIQEFMNEEKISSAVLAGCSMGGYILFDFWRKAPQQVRGLVLCDTRPEADSDEARENRMKTIDQIRSEGLDFLADSMIFRLPGTSTREQNQDLLESIRTMILSNSPIGVIHALQAMASRRDSTALLPEINVPVLAMVGEEDPVTPPNVVQSMAGQIAGTEYVEIPRAGHLAPLEQPDAVNTALLAFLNKHFA